MSVSTIADICTRSDDLGMGLIRSKHSFLLTKPIGTQSPAHLCTKMDTPSSPLTGGTFSCDNDREHERSPPMDIAFNNIRYPVIASRVDTGVVAE